MTIVPVNLSNQPPKKTFKDRVVTTSANVVGLGVGMAMPYTILKDSLAKTTMCDAKNTAELFAIVRNEERRNMILKVVMDVLQPKNTGNTLGDLFDFSALRAQIA